MAKIRKFQKRDTEAVAWLIFNTFKKFNSGDHFDERGVQRYLNRYNPENHRVEDIYRHLTKTPIFYVAVEHNKVIGVIRGRIYDLINLYVDGECHGRGIGRELMKRFEKEVKRRGGKNIKIKSSVHALPFYEKMGYKKSTGLRNFKGVKVYPMKKRLK